jgi:hypothetical protein
MAENDFVNSFGSLFYFDTFNVEMSVVWEKVFPGGIDDLCYRALLSSFKDSSAGNVLARQNALYHLLKGPFAYDQASDPLNQYRKLLPTRNWTAKALDALCIAYNDDPRRRFSTNDTVNKVLSRYYQQAQAGVELRWAHAQSTLQNYILTRPYFDWRGDMQFQMMLPDAFSVKWHPFDAGRMEEVWIATSRPDYRSPAGKIVFQVWSGDTITYRDVYGEQVGRVLKNNYGRIPFVPLQMVRSRSTDDPLGGGMYDLVMANIIDNALQWGGMNSVLFNSFSVWVSTNLKWGDRARLFPGKLVAVEDATAGSQMDPRLPPDLNSVGSDGQYSMIDEYRQNQKEDQLFDLGLPDFMASRRGNVPTTATEQIIKSAGLIDRRNRDLPILNAYERDLAEMVCLVARVDRGERGLPERLDEFQSDFAEPRIALDTDKELAADARLVGAGLLRIESFVAKWEGLEQIPTEEEAIKRIQDRVTIYAAVLPYISSLSSPGPSIGG